MNDLHRLPNRNDNARLLAAIQQSQLQILRGATDTAAGQVAHADNGTDNGTPPGGTDRGDSAGAQRAGCARAGEGQNNGGAAASNES